MFLLDALQASCVIMIILLYTKYRQGVCTDMKFVIFDVNIIGRLTDFCMIVNIFMISTAI